MKHTLFLFFLCFSIVAAVHSQPPDRKPLRIVDTLSAQERATRNPVLSKAELDSLAQAYLATQPIVRQPQEPVKEVVTETPTWVYGLGLLTLLVFALLLLRLSSYQRRLNQTVGDLKRLIQNFDFYATAGAPTNGAPRTTKGKTAGDKKLGELAEELERQKSSHALLMEEYESVKQGIAEAYKIKNYPSYDKEKKEGQVIRDLLKTERSVASHAFEKFLKPVMAIADANKNNPARISKEDSERLIELLVSMSLYHIEYLYLRINDLSVGGTIVQRIGSNGKGIDPTLLKKLNTEHGSRALAVRMALNKVGINKLTYPVFDETDLNNF